MTGSVFISGGTGFVAPHLLRALLGRREVHVHVRRLSDRLLKEFGDSCRFVPEPLSNAGVGTCLPEGVDTVIHLAGAVSASSTSELLQANVVTTANVLEIMARRAIPHLVFLSTAAVWSDATGSRIDEKAAPAPNTPYGFAKLAAESLIVDAVAQGRVKSATILRCNNTYGPGGYQGVVANFYHRLLADQPVMIDGDGQQLREPLFVGDLVELLLKAMAQRTGLNIYGIGGPEPLTVRQIAQTIAEVTGRELKVDWGGARQDRSRHLLISTQKVHDELGWAPVTCLRDGIRAMLDAE